VRSRDGNRPLQSICAVSTVGTPLYFSPELCEGREYNEKSDVWALGCVLFELAALSPPFVSNNAIALGRCADLPPVSIPYYAVTVLCCVAGRMITTVLPPRLPRTYTADLEDVIFQMLDKDPGRRPSIDALLELPSVLLRV
jgi:serine/threonine protein kinase